MKGLSLALAIIFTLAVGVMGVLQISNWLEFKSNCGDYLKLAGDAPTLEMANDYIGQALSYIDEHNLNQGNSAYFFHTPKNNLKIWSDQIRGAYQTTQQMLAQIAKDPNAVPQLERDNALMKVREVLLDTDAGGTNVTQPNNITVYPNQWGFVWGWVISLAGALVCWIWYYVVRD